jgi:hypothetical protein
MDWVSIGEVVKVLGSAATAGAAWFGASIAYRGLNKWRDETVGKRKTELAEQALVGVYEARDVFVWTRSRGILGGEGGSRAPAVGESKTQQEQRNIYFVPIERLTHENELFARLHSLRYAFAAHFGEASIEPFKQIMEVHNTIITSATVLMDIIYDDGDTGASFRSSAEGLLNTIGWGPAERPDDIDRKISEAIHEMEKFCRPVLLAPPK